MLHCGVVVLSTFVLRLALRVHYFELIFKPQQLLFILFELWNLLEALAGISSDGDEGSWSSELKREVGVNVCAQTVNSSRGMLVHMSEDVAYSTIPVQNKRVPSTMYRTT